MRTQRTTHSDTALPWGSPRTPSRRALLRLSASGAGLAALGAGAAACGGKDTAGGAAHGTAHGTADSTRRPGPPEPLWTASVPEASLGSLRSPVPLAVAGGTVVVCGDPLTGYDLETGKKLWSRRGAAADVGAMLVNGGTPYTATPAYERVVGIEPATGRQTWQSRLGRHYADPLPVAADDAHLYVTAVTTGADPGISAAVSTDVLAAVSKDSGTVVWHVKLPVENARVLGTTGLVGNRLAWAGCLRNGKLGGVAVYDTATGHRAWTRELQGVPSGDLCLDRSAVIVTDGPRLRAFGIEDGHERWTLTADDDLVFSSPALLDGVVYAADDNGALWAVDARTGRRKWTHQPERASSQAGRVAVSGGVVYGTTGTGDEGGVAALSARDGSLLWRYTDGHKDDRPWYVLAAGRKLLALHGRQLHALPAA